ncbi:MAG: hypothetical protein M3Y91_04725 [Actinomycetota bacterium]|nr:hypothetical protein [Actinomycetota bacterium]
MHVGVKAAGSASRLSRSQAVEPARLIWRSRFRSTPLRPGHGVEELSGWGDVEVVAVGHVVAQVVFQQLGEASHRLRPRLEVPQVQDWIVVHVLDVIEGHRPRFVVPSTISEGNRRWSGRSRSFRAFEVLAAFTVSLALAGGLAAGWVMWRIWSIMANRACSSTWSRPCWRSRARVCSCGRSGLWVDSAAS